MKKEINTILFLMIFIISCNDEIKSTGDSFLKIDDQRKEYYKLIEESYNKDDKILYVYLVNELNGTVGLYLGQCLSYGIEVNSTNRIDFPNGKWLIMIDSLTKRRELVLIQGNVIISPIKLK